MKKNLPLIAGIAIPIALILFVTGSIYIPGIFIHPRYNFLYASGGFYGRPYQVIDGHLAIATDTATQAAGTPAAPMPGYPPGGQQTFFVYDVATNQSHEISPADAVQLTLDANEQSPDGFTVVSGNSGSGFFPFFSGSTGDYNARYLEGHNMSRKLNLSATTGNYPYPYSFRFIGWITD